MQTRSISSSRLSIYCWKTGLAGQPRERSKIAAIARIQNRVIRNLRRRRTWGRTAAFAILGCTNLTERVATFYVELHCNPRAKNSSSPLRNMSSAAGSEPECCCFEDRLHAGRRRFSDSRRSGGRPGTDVRDCRGLWNCLPAPGVARPAGTRSSPLPKPLRSYAWLSEHPCLLSDHSRRMG